MSTVVKTPLRKMNPCVLPSASSYSPATALLLFPLAAVRVAAGTSTVVKKYGCAFATRGMPTSRPRAVVARTAVLFTRLGNGMESTVVLFIFLFLHECGRCARRFLSFLM